MATQLNVREFIDEQPLSGFQKWIIALCLLVVIVDGLDVAVMGFIAPSLKEQWGISNSDLAPVISAALFGLTIGAMVAGPMADKFGRKKVLLVCVWGFGLFTLAGALADSVSHLVVLRFIAGLFMGGVMPQCVTLATEYSPKRITSFLITVVICGFSLGAAMGGFLASWLIPAFGWQSMLVVAGIVPCLLALVLTWKLPESTGFMILKKQPSEKIRRYIAKIATEPLPKDVQFVLPAAPAKADKPMQTVLNSHYLIGTLCLWGCYFFGLFAVYLLGSWLPLITKEAGFTTSESSIIAAVFQLGGPLGCITVGYLMDKFGNHRVLALCYVAVAASLAAIVMASGSFALFCVVCFLIGATLNGGNTGMNALSSVFYPVSARATGNSWMHGVGRIGAILSAFVGAHLLNLGWHIDRIFLMLMIPALLVTVCIVIKGMRYGKTKPEVQLQNKTV